MKASLSIQDVETADKVLRSLIEDARKDKTEFPNSKLARDNLDALYNVQSRLVGILEDMRMIRH